MKKNITFLLIDDDADDRELFEIALEETTADIECVTAASCSHALDLLHAGTVKPDYIFLDLNMPEMSGRECLAALKAAAALAHIPVIIFSTSSDPQDVAHTRQLGAVDFITKPSKVSELSHIIDSFITAQLHKH